MTMDRDRAILQDRLDGIAEQAERLRDQAEATGDRNNARDFAMFACELRLARKALDQVLDRRPTALVTARG